MPVSSHALSWFRWLRIVGPALAASTIAMLLQQVVRAAWQVRTLPERIMEWLLLFVPLDLFEGGLQRFGANAKDLALVGTFVGMLVVLVAIGAMVLRSPGRSWSILAVGPLLWVFTMLVVMPVTGAGVFATGLLVNPIVTDAAYGVVFSAYAAALVIGAAAFRKPARPVAAAPVAVAANRRMLLAGLTGLLGAIVAYGIGRAAGPGAAVQSSLPLASAPTSAAGLTATPTAPQTITVSASSTAPPAATPMRVAATPTRASESAAAFPTPPPVRALARDQEGSLTAAGRPAGTLAPPLTANQDFYIVTKNAVADPALDANTWRLIIDGQVNHAVQVDYATLRALPSVEITKTLECISNLTAGCNMTGFGCNLISTARWRGARLSDVLDLAGGLQPDVVAVAFLATDEFSSGLPSDVVLDPATLLVYEMNGQLLPREHGFPARVLVPGRYGMKNPKWLAGIRAMNQPYADWYQQRGWTKDGLIKTMSRIDLPIDGAVLSAGPQRIAGIAYAGDRGIQSVEFSADAGATWQAATFLEAAPQKDAMVRWEGSFSMPQSGTLDLVVRATDGLGTVQPEDFGLPAPDGAWGQDMIQVQSA